MSLTYVNANVCRTYKDIYSIPEGVYLIRPRYMSFGYSSEEVLEIPLTSMITYAVMLRKVEGLLTRVKVNWCMHQDDGDYKTWRWVFEEDDKISKGLSPSLRGICLYSKLPFTCYEEKYRFSKKPDWVTNYYITPTF